MTLHGRERIKELGEAMRSFRTLGEYYASLDPHTHNVRRRWTSRKMYEDEFAAIWEKQAALHPTLLTEELHRQIKHLLFYQRPIKAQSHLIGGCELEPASPAPPGPRWSAAIPRSATG